ncbi:hypothetical protein LguiA_007683 [Lonicera macranthoides]
MGEGRWWKKDEKMMVVVGIRMKVRDGGRSGGRRSYEGRFFSHGFRASPVDKKSAAVFFSVGAESSSKSEFVLEKDITF